LRSKLAAFIIHPSAFILGLNRLTVTNVAGPLSQKCQSKAAPGEEFRLFQTFQTQVALISDINKSSSLPQQTLAKRFSRYGILHAWRDL
jgi:hypothetical protein